MASKKTATKKGRSTPAPSRPVPARKRAATKAARAIKANVATKRANKVAAKPGASGPSNKAARAKRARADTNAAKRTTAKRTTAKRPAARAAGRSYTGPNAGTQARSQPLNAPRKRPNARMLMALSEGFSESLQDKHKRALAIDEELTRLYPDAHCELDYNNAFELLIATILAAQCTDVTVNKVTKVLFAHYPDPRALAKATTDEIEPIIKATGFFRNKAKAITGCAQQLVEKHGAEVPKTMDELTALPGVARKTANVVLGNAYKINVGFVVDTHIGRISQLLRLTDSDDPKVVERDMMALFPQDTWDMVSHRIIFHGRRCCVAKKPDCAVCGLNKLNLCPSADPAA